MKTKDNKLVDRNLLKEKRLIEAQSDFNKLMLQVEPFIKKSEIIVTSTEGKWCVTSEVMEQITIQNTFPS